MRFTPAPVERERVKPSAFRRTRPALAIRRLAASRALTGDLARVLLSARTMSTPLGRLSLPLSTALLGAGLLLGGCADGARVAPAAPCDAATRAPDGGDGALSPAPAPDAGQPPDAGPRPPDARVGDEDAGPPSEGPVRLGLHYTAEELAIWRERAETGPYRTAGDAGHPDTPGDWARIEAHAAEFADDPTAELWTGWTGGGCAPRSSDAYPCFHCRGYTIRDAAFVSLVRDDAALRDRVLEALLAQARAPGADFGDDGLWCLDGDERHGDTGAAFGISEWATRVLFAYDYVRRFASPSEREELDGWFRDAAHYFRRNGDEDVARLYDDWEAGVLGDRGRDAADNCDTDYAGPMGRTHIGGNRICTLGKFFNNRRAHMMRFYGLVGIMLDDPIAKQWARRWVIEYLEHHVYPDGTLNELHRGHGRNAALGWAYAFQTYGDVMDVVDAFARAGDPSLYELVTEEGRGPNRGGPKSVRSPARFFVETSEGDRLLYNWDTRESVENLIDGVWHPEDYYAYEVWLAQYNIYWNDDAVRAAYLEPGPRNRHGTSSNREPDFSWMGSGKAYPGKLFMFGDMEGAVWPYPAPDA